MEQFQLSSSFEPSYMPWGDTGRFSTEPAQLMSLMEKLQTTLDVCGLLTIFSSAAAKIIPHSGISFIYEKQQYKSKTWRDSEVTLGLKLTLEGETLGYLLYNARAHVDKAQKQQLVQLQKRLFFPMKNALTFIRLQKQALKDPLTHLDNRASFDDALGTMLSRCRRLGSKSAVLVMDMDHFKAVNDNFGHLTGDKVLKEFALCLENSIRGNDRAFRFGGDEFAVLLDDAGHPQSVHVAQRIISNVSKNPVLAKYGVSCSIGMALAAPEHTVDSLFEQADNALYLAKDAGRACLKTA